MRLELAFAQPLHDSPAQVPAHLRRSARQLRQSFHHIANRINVINAGPLHLVVSCLYLLALCGLHSDLLEVKSVGGRRPSHCHQNCVELLRRPDFIALLIFDGDAEPSVFLFFDSIGERSLNDVDLPLLQVFENEGNHVSIEGAKVISSRHEAHAVSHSVQEACDFHCDVAASDDERLAGRSLLHEDVVAADGVIGAVELQVGRPCSGGNQEVAGPDLVVQGILVVVLGKLACFDVLVDDLGILRTDERVLVLEGRQAVQVIQSFLPVDVGNIPEVDRFDVALHSVLQLGPVELPRQLLVFAAIVYLLGKVPSVFARVGDFLARLCGLVHQLLGNAAHVYARPSEAPLRLVRRFLHEIDDYHIQTVLVGFEGSCEPARAPADHCQIVLLLIGLHGGLGRFGRGEGKR